MEVLLMRWFLSLCALSACETTLSAVPEDAGACWAIEACRGVTIEACDNSAPCVCVENECYCAPSYVPNPEALCAR